MHDLNNLTKEINLVQMLMNFINFTLLYKRVTHLAENDINMLYDFTRTVGWRLLLDLNALQRKEGRWEPSNTMELLAHLADTDRMSNLDLQLGNGMVILGIFVTEGKILVSGNAEYQ